MAARKHRETGGVNAAEEDLRDTPKNRGAASNVSEEAEERKHGGKARKHRRHGGHARKEVEMHGHESKHHAGRKPRKSGGRTGADSMPYSSARKGTPPKGHQIEMETAD